MNSYMQLPVTSQLPSATAETPPLHCIDKNINGGKQISFFPTVKSFKSPLNKCCFLLSSLLSLFTVSLSLLTRAALVSLPLSLSLKTKKRNTFFYWVPKGRKKARSSAADRKPPQRLCHSQKQQRRRCHSIGFAADQWEGSIGGECCEKGK